MKYELYEEIKSALNRHSAENASDTPDFALASFLSGCLDSWDHAMKLREQYHGRTCGSKKEIDLRAMGEAMFGELPPNP